MVTISGIDHQLAVTAGGKTGSMFFVNETKTVPINLFGIMEVYTLINSTFGSFGAINGKVEVHGTGGLLDTFTLTQGINIRDHFAGPFNNVATGLNGTLPYQTGVRFDQQKFVLSSAFHSATLTEIRFIGENNFGSNGNPMLQSLNLRAVPEPASMVVLGLGLVALVRRKSRVR